MARTERTRLHWRDNQVSIDYSARDNKPRCDCCGNSEQKRQNKRDRATTKRNLRNPTN